MINLTQDTVGGMFDKYADMVYRIALNIVKSREEAQDIVMETFLALIKQEYFESGDHVKAWLIRTAQNKALTAADLEARLQKTGGTAFRCAARGCRRL